MVKEHKCPICSQITDNEKYKPFCSKRCADIDLGRWFDGAYAIAAQEMDEADYEELEQEIQNIQNKNPQE